MTLNKKSSQVSSMFASIADRYDLTNDVLSFGLHRLWESRAIKQLKSDSGLDCLDLCTGTGALLKGLLKKYDRVTGADFCEEMLEIARLNYADQIKSGQLTLDWADAMNLHYPDNNFDLITIAYGVRNFENLEKGLAEVGRVLKPGGQLMILEFGQPRGWIAPFYKFYARYLMPLLGSLLTGNKAAYQYLPETAGAFPCGSKFLELFSNNRANTKMLRLSGGIAYIYVIVNSK